MKNNWRNHHIFICFRVKLDIIALKLIQDILKWNFDTYRPDKIISHKKWIDNAPLN